MRVVQIDPRWVAARIPNCERGFGECVALGVQKGNVVIAGFVFHNWCPHSAVIEISGAADDPKWGTRSMVTELLNYAFKTVAVQLIVARNAPDNDRASKFWRAIGCNEYQIPRLRGRDTAETIFTLTDDQWAISRFNNGKARRSQTSRSE